MNTNSAMFYSPDYTFIIWNGTDGYIELSEAESSPDYKFIRGELVTRTESFSPIKVRESEASTLTDDDEVFLTVSGNWYKS